MLEHDDLVRAAAMIDAALPGMEHDAQPLTIYLRRAASWHNNLRLSAVYMHDRQIVHHTLFVERSFPTVGECVASTMARLKDVIDAAFEKRPALYVDSTERLDVPAFWLTRLDALDTLKVMAIDCALFPDSPVSDIKNPERHGTIPDYSALYDLHDAIDLLAANPPRLYASDMRKKDQ